MKIVKPLVSGLVIAAGSTGCSLVESEPKTTLPPAAEAHQAEIEEYVAAQVIGEADTKSCIYEIQPGDDLLKIGNLVGLSITYLIAENGIENMSQINAGDELDVCYDGINAFNGESRAYLAYTDIDSLS